MRPVALLVLIGALLAALAVGGASRFGASSGTSYSVKKIDSVDPQATGRWGERLATAGDLNGDGASEFYSADLSEDVAGRTNAGRVYLHNGKDGSVIRAIDSPELQANAQFGFFITVFGDVNGDGKNEIAIGTDSQDVYTGLDKDGVPNTTPCGQPEPNGCNEDQGKLWIFNGATGGLIRGIDNPDPQGNTGNSARFGSRLGSAGDVTGDGVSDLIAGASNNDVPAGCGNTSPTPAGCHVNQGQAYIFNGATGSLVRTLNIPDARTAPCSSNCGTFGLAVQSPGDTNGDGVPDQLVDAGNFNYNAATPGDAPCEPGAGCNSGQGRMYLFSGADGALLHRLDDPVPQAGATFGFQDAAPNSPGDVNGDGFADLYGNGFLQDGPAGSGQGRAAVFNGKTGALLYMVDDPAPTEGGQFGWSLARTDYNKDGRPDLYVGQSPHHVATASEDGGSYVFNGPDGATLKSLELPAEDSQTSTATNGGPRLGWGLASPGDLNGDGEPDFLAGAPFLDVGANQDQGRFYMFMSNVPGQGGQNTTTPGKPIPGVNAPKRATSARTFSIKGRKRGGIVAMLATGRLRVTGGSVISRKGASTSQVFPLRLCDGRVRIKTYYRGKLVANRLGRVTGDCRWSKRYAFPKTRLPRNRRANGVPVRLTIKVYYRGDRYLRRSRTVTKKRTVR